MVSRGALALLALMAASCGAPSPSPSQSGPSGAASASAGTAVAPGRPYDAAALLTGMRESRRPGGVPDRLETVAVAEAISMLVWTWDGQPWDVLAIGGACGPGECTLDVAGSRQGAPGSDLYSFVVAGDGSVTLLTTDLHAYDPSLDATLDRAAQQAAGDALNGLTYIGARWLVPPDRGRYWLAYRSGGEEGSPGVDLLLDLASGEVVELRRV
jgi:hypothetical protein